MAGTAPKLVIKVVSPLTVTSADGRDCTPKGQRAKGILALLARSHKCRRTRNWLQDKLWSTRPAAQGAASLRQSLTEIRKAFGGARDCLVTSGNLVALNLDHVTIDDDVAGHAELDGPDGPILFEDLDISDDEFETWLREQRMQFSDHSKSTGKASGEPISIATRDDANLLRLVIYPRSGNSSARERLVADNVTDIVAKTLAELCEIDVVDFRGDPTLDDRALYRSSNTIALRADAADNGAVVECRVSLSSPSERRLLWSTDVRTAQSSQFDETVLRNVNQIAAQSIRHLQQRPDCVSAKLICLQGIERMFRLKQEDLLAADRLFERAFALEPRGIYLAWRGYLRTFLICEFIPPNRAELGEEALAMTRRALELDPTNSYVAAFAAHVQSIVRQSHVAAFELAERSVQLNPANPIGWGTLGISECYLGKTTNGFQHTLLARELSGATPFRFFVSAQACFAGSMAGDVSGAVLLAEASHGLAPAFKPPMRFLSALYALTDRYEESQRVVDNLRLTEPNFSYDLLRDKSYPASSLHRSGLLQKLPQRQI